MIDCKTFQELTQTRNFMEMTRGERATLVHHQRTCPSCVVWTRNRLAELEAKATPEQLENAQAIVAATVAADNQDPEFVEAAGGPAKKTKPKKNRLESESSGSQ